MVEEKRLDMIRLRAVLSRENSLIKTKVICAVLEILVVNLKQSSQEKYLLVLFSKMWQPLEQVLTKVAAPLSETKKTD